MKQNLEGPADAPDPLSRAEEQSETLEQERALAMEQIEAL